MCGARFLWALASTCTSLALLAAPAAAARPDAATLELGLASSRALYLVVDPDSGRLSIRARGLELDAVTITRVEIAWGASSARAGAPPTPGLPAVWRLTEGPAEEWRRVVAPAALSRYDRESDGSTVPSPTPASPRPERYDLPTDAGWRLAIGSSASGLVASGFWARVGRGWKRLVGSPPPPMPPTLLLVVHPEDARRLVHLFRPGTAVLVARGAAPATAGTPSGPSAGQAAASPR